MVQIAGQTDDYEDIATCPHCGEELTVGRFNYRLLWWCPECGRRYSEVEYDGPDTVEEARGER